MSRARRTSSAGNIRERARHWSSRRSWGAIMNRWLTGMHDDTRSWSLLQCYSPLVRYADDFVVLARCQGERLRQFVEGTIEGWMGLTINREKTRVVSLSKGESLDFLGFTLQYHRDLRGRDHRYLHVMPSKKAMARERAKLRQMTDSRFCFKPIPALIRELNRNLRGWANYFDYGHPRRRFREINWYVRQRLKFHLRRRSQRPFRPPKGVSFYKHLATLGLDYL